MSVTIVTLDKDQDLRPELDHDNRRCYIGGEPHVFHCHHYNTFLQQTILDAEYIDSRPFLVGAAAEVTYSGLKALFATVPASSRLKVAQELYRWSGFGTFDLSGLTADGGEVSTHNSHYAMAWRSKFGSADKQQCYFASGWLAGALAAIYDQPLGSFSVEHDSCHAVHGEGACTFKLARGEANYKVFKAAGRGAAPAPRGPSTALVGNVDYDGIYGALIDMPICGDADGVIPAFGVYLTRHYANYYNRISFELENALVAEFGAIGREVAEPLLVEAGHVCAFNTFGGIMTSPEWDGMIKPQLKDTADWVHGITAAVNALGWGRWEVAELSDDRALFRIYEDYESVGYAAMYGKAEHPVSYLHAGAAAGIMNLVHIGDVASKPEFTPEFYQRLFKADDTYSSKLIVSSAQGEPATLIEVTR